MKGDERLCGRCVVISFAEGPDEIHEYRWHETYAQLLHSALSGCELCEFVDQVCSPTSKARHLQGNEGRVGPVRLWSSTDHQGYLGTPIYVWFSSLVEIELELFQIRG